MPFLETPKGKILAESERTHRTDAVQELLDLPPGQREDLLRTYKRSPRLAWATFGVLRAWRKVTRERGLR